MGKIHGGVLLLLLVIIGVADCRKVKEVFVDIEEGDDHGGASIGFSGVFEECGGGGSNGGSTTCHSQGGGGGGVEGGAGHVGGNKTIIGLGFRV